MKSYVQVVIKTNGRQLWDGRWRLFAESPLCRVFDTRQTCLCRVLSYAECPALGKGSLCREPDFTECGSRQSLLCWVPDKRHSAKNPTLGKASDSGSVSQYYWIAVGIYGLTGSYRTIVRTATCANHKYCNDTWGHFQANWPLPTFVSCPNRFASKKVDRSYHSIVTTSTTLLTKSI
jgi:hypothetical protein